ncbi:MAG: hypothetical protein HQM12_10610 [SAR324 cluster bacterium]|nr:hypothetical protein [SAR324 cluster bacterium]
MHENFFDQTTYLKQKRRQKRQAWFLMITGLVILLDSGSAMPVPLVGLPSIIVGVLLMVWGYFQYQSCQRLPLHEALMLTRQMGGMIKRSDLFLNLLLSPEDTDLLIQALVHEGFIEPLDTGLPPENEISYRLIS